MNDERSALPAESAFVLQFRPGTVPEEGRMAGRVEHVASGRSQHFTSLPELLAFLGQVLRNVRDDAR